MSVRPVAAADTFCTIMSTFAPDFATILKISAALPGTSGTPMIVIFAWLRSVATPATIGSSISSPSPPAGSVMPGPSTQVPSPELNVDRAWISTPWRRAYSTARMYSTFAPLAASSSISSLETCVELLRLRHDAGIGGEDAVHVAVDLAHVGLERGGERDGGRVGAAAAERRDVAGVAVEALEAGDDDDRALVERFAQADRGDIDDPGGAVRGIRDHARLASR